MRDLKRYGVECINEMEAMGIDMSKLPTIDWIVNKRAKRRFGQCCYNRMKGRCEINISQFLLNEDITPNEDALKNTIIHELLHALNPGEGHKGKWKEMANCITRKSNGRYIIKRCTSYEEKGINKEDLHLTKHKSLQPKYIIRCRECGGQTVRTKKTKVIKRPDLYRCGRCRGKLEIISFS